MGIMSDLFDKIFFFSFIVAIAGSQIETAIFLKTLNVNTMMTNTAGKIIVALTIFSYTLALINTLVLPSPRVKQSENFDKILETCKYLPPMDIFMVIPGTLLLMLVLSVMGFGVFRGLQIRKRQDNEDFSDNLCLEELRQETGLRSRDAPPHGRLFTIQAAISELNQATPRIIEEDLVIQDIELDESQEKETDSESNINVSDMPENQRKGIGHEGNKPSQGLLFNFQEVISDLDQETTRHNEETSPSSLDQVMNDESQIQEQETNSENSENQQNQIGCVPLPSGMNMILKTIQKYLKNTAISLLIVTCLIPEDLLFIYGFIKNSGCEDPIIRTLAEISEYGFFMYIILPFLIKLRLDRLSE